MKVIIFLILLFNLSNGQDFLLKRITNNLQNYDSPILFGSQTENLYYILYRTSEVNKSNIGILKYYPTIDSFLNIFNISDNSFINTNASACYLKEVGFYIIWQTNENNNFDIAYRFGGETFWTPRTFLTSSIIDEINPTISPSQYEINEALQILYEKENSIHYLYLNQIPQIEEIIFSGNDSIKYKNPTGYLLSFNGKVWGYIVACKESLNQNSKIVYKFKDFNDSLWSEEKTVFDSGYCSNPKFFKSILTFESIINNKKQSYYFNSPHDFGKNSSTKLINPYNEYESSDLNIFIPDNQYVQNLNGNIPVPYTYKLKKGDSTFIFVSYRNNVNELKDTLIYVKYPNSNPVVGLVEERYTGGNDIGYLVYYTVWPDSFDGKLSLFGVKRIEPMRTIYVQEDFLENFSFSLYQNYPNPFNNKSKIRFRISDFGFTSLKIYDLLGREIANLINEEKGPGEYEIELDADKLNLSSGVYIYQLKNNSFVQSKKFTLMK